MFSFITEIVRSFAVNRRTRLMPFHAAGVQKAELAASESVLVII
jgi:hypothetical protein